jgi:hypothetical protein
VWIAITLVADGLERGAVLDTLGGQTDASAVRALIEGTLLIYNGSIAFAIAAMFLGAAGHATFATGVPPRWTGWLSSERITPLPLVFGQVANAFVFSVLNGAALAWRIRLEEIALSRRRASSRRPTTRV